MDIGFEASSITDSTHKTRFLSLSVVTSLYCKDTRVKYKQVGYYSCHTINGTVFAQKVKDGNKIKMISIRDFNYQCLNLVI